MIRRACLLGPARQEQVEAVAERYHLRGPILEQYEVYMSGLLRGDLGLSVTTRRPVIEDLAQFLPATIELTASAFLITILVGIPVGSCRRQSVAGCSIMRPVSSPSLAYHCRSFGLGWFFKCSLQAPRSSPSGDGSARSTSRRRAVTGAPHRFTPRGRSVALLVFGHPPRPPALTLAAGAWRLSPG